MSCRPRRLPRASSPADEERRHEASPDREAWAAASLSSPEETSARIQARISAEPGRGIPRVKREAMARANRPKHSRKPGRERVPGRNGEGPSLEPARCGLSAQPRSGVSAEAMGNQISRLFLPFPKASEADLPDWRWRGDGWAQDPVPPGCVNQLLRVIPIASSIPIRTGASCLRHTFPREQARPPEDRASNTTMVPSPTRIHDAGERGFPGHERQRGGNGRSSAFFHGRQGKELPLRDGSRRMGKVFSNSPSIPLGETVQSPGTGRDDTGRFSGSLDKPPSAPAA